MNQMQNLSIYLSVSICKHKFCWLHISQPRVHKETMLEVPTRVLAKVGMPEQLVEVLLHVVSVGLGGSRLSEHGWVPVVGVRPALVQVAPPCRHRRYTWQIYIRLCLLYS